MSNPHSRPGAWNWGYLIKVDKTAAPLLEQLCLGLSRIICRLGGRSGPEHELRPEQLAHFYRSLGGNLDTLLLDSSEYGLSFLYRTLGCFHSLEPTQNAFETPKVPCLTPAGFVRWQTIQILLCPEEHVRYIQEALRLYDVPRPDGSLFPKSVPREAFPMQPDVQMEDWHNRVLNQLKSNPQRRIQSSPYRSPKSQGNDGSDGYFGRSIPRIRRPSRSSRERTSDDEPPKLGPPSRRRSEPFIVSPDALGAQSKPPSSYHRDGKQRSSSTQRDRFATRPRSATTDFQHTYQSPSNSSSHYRETSNSRSRPSSQQQRPYVRSPRRDRSRRTSAEGLSSAGEASSEDSILQQSRRRQEGSQKAKTKPKQSLFLSSLNPFSHKRRHSHDATPNADKGEPRRRREDMSSSARVSPSASMTRPPPQVQFDREAMSRSRSVRESSASDPRSSSSNRYKPMYPQTAPTTATEAEFPIGAPLSREFSSGSNTDARSGYDSATRHKRNSDVPLRIATISGVGGRRYPNAQPQSAGGSAPSPDGRARHSVAV